MKYRERRSHGSGAFNESEISVLGENVVFEAGVLIFHPENVEIGDHVYVGHNTILKGYYMNKLIIGSGTWIGQNCFFHSAGNICIGENVGIGPGVNIITSQHRVEDEDTPVLYSPVEMAEVIIENNADIGVSSTILPGVRIGQGAIVAAGSVVNRSIPDHEVWGGVPAKKIKSIKN